MPRVFIIATAWALAAAWVPPPAYAYLGQVVASFPAPASNPRALAAGGPYLYVWCFNGPYNIFRVNRASGSVVGSFLSPMGNLTSGLGYESGGYLWVGRKYGVGDLAWVARCREATGSVVSSFYVPEHHLDGGLDCQGDPTRPGTLTSIISDAFYTNWMTRHTPAGVLLGSFPYGDGLSFGDPAWDYVNKIIWFPDHPHVVSYVYGYTAGGSFVTSFRAPASYAWGAAYLGGYLWICTAIAPARIWKVHCPGNIGVEPASLGRVKALYR